MVEEPWYNPIVIALSGMSVPLGSSERMYREVEVPHRELVAFLDGLQDAITQVAEGTAAGASGAWSQDYVRAMSTFASGDGADMVQSLKDTATQLADASHEFGYQLDYTLVTIVGQVVLFLFEWALTVVLMLIDPVEAQVEQIALQMIFRLLFRKTLSRLALEAAIVVGVGVGLSVAVDGLARWILASQGKHTSQGAAYHKQSVVFGAIQGAIGALVPFATAGVGKLLSKLVVPRVVRAVEKAVQSGLHRPVLLGPARSAGKDVGRVADGALPTVVRESGPAGSHAAIGDVIEADLASLDGWFSQGLAKAVAPVAVTLQTSVADTEMRGLFRLRVQTLFAEAFATPMGTDTARSMGRSWADAFLSHAGQPTLVNALDDSLRPLATKLGRLRTELSDGVARALPSGTSWHWKRLLVETPLNAAHQNLSEGLFNVWLTGEFTTSGFTTVAGAVGSLISNGGHRFAAPPTVRWLKDTALSLGPTKLSLPAVAAQHINVSTVGGHSSTPPLTPGPEPEPEPTTGAGADTGGDAVPLLVPTRAGTDTRATAGTALLDPPITARPSLRQGASAALPTTGQMHLTITPRTDTVGSAAADTVRSALPGTEVITEPEGGSRGLGVSVPEASEGIGPPTVSVRAPGPARTPEGGGHTPVEPASHPAGEPSSPSHPVQPSSGPNPAAYRDTAKATTAHDARQMRALEGTQTPRPPQPLPADRTDRTARAVDGPQTDGSRNLRTRAEAVLRGTEHSGDMQRNTATTRLPTIHESDGTEGAGGPAQPHEGTQRSSQATMTRPAPRPMDSTVRHPPLGLPPYLRELRAPGLSTAYALTGHGFVSTTLSKIIGRSDGTVAEITDELAGRPETFYGRGRSFTVEGAKGSGWYEVTVTISRGRGDLPESFVSPETTKARTAAAEQNRKVDAFLAGLEASASKGKSRAEGLGGDAGRQVTGETVGPPSRAGAVDTAENGGLGDARQREQAARLAEGVATKVDVQHNTSGVVSHSVAGSSGLGANFTAFGLAPVAPGVWLGGAMTANIQPFHTSADSRVQKTTSEPRVLRSDKGSVEMTRRVRYTVRIERRDQPPQTFTGDGTLLMRVPTEHLVPVTTEVPGPALLRPLDKRSANRLRLADSLAPFALDDPTASPPGGRDLFDTVRSVLHPSLTSLGAPGRARLHKATSPTTVLEDLPRLLNGWVVGDDLAAKDGSVTGTYRMRAELTELAPAWAVGRTQLRTHQQIQHAVTVTAGKGRAATIGVGPAAGFGVLGNAAAVRATVMPTVGVRTSRYSVTEQTLSSRQGAEVRGDKALYLGRVRFSVEGTGPLSPAMKAGAASRTALHTMDVWFGLRADEARSLGLDLPAGMKAGASVGEPGAEATARHLPFGAMGSSVALSQLDTTDLLSGIERLFATDPRLAGYLPEFGKARWEGITRRNGVSVEEAEVQRRNYRELVTVLSETNLRVNKDQLLSSGIRVRMRRKSRWHTHDVQIRVAGTLGETEYVGDTKDWLVRSHSGVASSAQSGRSGSRSLGALALGQFRLLPGTLTASLRGERTWQKARRTQAGPVTRSDVLTNGDETTSVFRGTLRFHVDVTMTARERTAKRAFTLGSAGRDVPAAEHIASSAHTRALVLGEQEVRLLTPRAFTVDTATKNWMSVRTSPPGPGPEPHRERFTADGIGDLSGMEPGPGEGGRAIRDWTLVETVGDGRPVRELAFELLAQAAGGNRPSREDRALEAEGLAPRLAIEERLGPRALTAALRQAQSSGWVVKDLHHPRRLAGLHGAVGTRLALTNPEVLAESTGAGTETLLLGGHQATGQEGHSVGTTVQGSLSSTHNATGWRLGAGVSAARNLSTSTTAATTMSGTVERNAHTPRGRPLYLVRCDLVVRMVAEVKVRGGEPHVAAGERTLPAAAAVWLTERQLRAAGLRPPESRQPAPGPARPATSGRSTASASSHAVSSAKAVPTAKDTSQAKAADSASGGQPPKESAAPLPVLAQEVPLGFGMIEDPPDFVPLLDRLRADLRRRDPALADALLPRRQLSDPHDNTQRLLRVLDRDGAAGLLSSAMDGGVPIELFHGRKSPYWAVFQVRRTGPGTVEAEANDGRDMEYITSATAQRTAARDTVDARTVEAVLAGAGKPEDGGGPLRSVAAAGGLGVGSTDTLRSASVGREQIGVKTVADASARSVSVRVPIEATLELRAAHGPVGSVSLGPQSLVHRILAKDLEALAGLRPVPRVRTGQVYLRPQDAEPARLDAWHRRGVTLPMEAQVNGFRGAPEIRQVIADTVRAAHGGERYGRTGDAAAYTQHEAVSTEWLGSALPLLSAAGVEMPTAHAFGARGQDLHTSLHTRLRNGRVLGLGDKMTFEVVAQSSLEAPRPTGTDDQQAVEHGKSVRGAGGAGVLNSTEFRMNQLLAGVGRTSSTTDTTANGSGSMPLHKPKAVAALVHFTLDVRAVARVTGPVVPGHPSVAVREFTLPFPVVLRIPAPVARNMLRHPANRSRLLDPDGWLS